LKLRKFQNLPFNGHSVLLINYLKNNGTLCPNNGLFHIEGILCVPRFIFIKSNFTITGMKNSYIMKCRPI